MLWFLHTTSVLSCYIDEVVTLLIWYSHPILMWYLHHWNVPVILYVCLCYALISSPPHHGSIRFFISPIKGIVDLTAFSSLVVPWVVITTICGVTDDGGVVGLTIYFAHCSINIISTHNITVILASLKCTWYLVKLFYYAWIISLHYHYRILFCFLPESRGS